MKKILVVLFAVISTASFAQSWKVEMYSIADYQTATPRIMATVFGTAISKSHPKVVFNTFFLVSQRSQWAEALYGPSYESKNFEAGIMAGLETDKNFWRISPWAWANPKGGRVSFLFVYENGSSGSWFNFESKVSVTKKNAKVKVQAGLMARRFHGVGPIAQFSSGKMYFLINPFLYDWEAKHASGMIGVGAKF